MLTTSYFAKSSYIETPVSISIKPPRWFTGKHFPLLAPPFDLVTAFKHNRITEQEYTEYYLEKILDPLNPIAVYDQIISTFGENPTLLCYEKSGDFCHRRIVAVWFELTIGITVPELTDFTHRFT
jgi:hypothetical protein